MRPNLLFWDINVFFLHSQSSSAPKLAVDDKIMSFRSTTPFCIPNINVVLAALDWRLILSGVGFGNIDAFPGHNGEILISAIRGDFCFEVTVESDLSASVAFERGEELIFVDDKLSIEKAKERLSEALREIWISSVGFTHVISMPAQGRIASLA